jgi:hypothetical protein
MSSAEAFRAIRVFNLVSLQVETSVASFTQDPPFQKIPILCRKTVSKLFFACNFSSQSPISSIQDSGF